MYVMVSRCKQCGFTSRSVSMILCCAKCGNHPTDKYEFNHIEEVPAKWINTSIWWNPSTWGTGYWEQKENE